MTRVVKKEMRLATLSPTARVLVMTSIIAVALAGCEGLLYGPDAVTREASVLVLLTGLQGGDDVDIEIGPEARAFVVAGGRSTADIYLPVPTGEHAFNLVIGRGEDTRCEAFTLDVDGDDADTDEGFEVYSFDFRFLGDDCDDDDDDNSDDDAGDDGDDGDDDTNEDADAGVDDDEDEDDAGPEEREDAGEEDDDEESSDGGESDDEQDAGITDGG